MIFVYCVVWLRCSLDVFINGLFFWDGGDIWLFITLAPKFYNNVFLFLGLITLGNFLNFDCLVQKVECPNVSTTNHDLQKG